jgi:hypothetical protein
MAVVPSAALNWTCVVISALTAALDWAGNTSLRPTSSRSLNSCTSCKQITDRCDRWDAASGCSWFLRSCPVLWQAKQGICNRSLRTQAKQQDALEAC